MAKLFQFTNNIDYNDIDNKPKINNVTVEGNKSLADYGIQPAGNYAHLNANGKVPLEEIDDSLLGNLQFQGLWDAKTNSPELPLNPTINGQYWIVSESGDRFGTDFNVGDWIVATNGAWRKVDNTDAVISVNGKIGKVVLTSEDIAHNDTTVSKAIDSEINRAKESEFLITSSLNNEIARAEAKEEEIKNVLVDHIKDNNNPHNVTKEQIGLGEVDNTSDINKPISNAVQLALNLKADKTEVYTKEESDEKFLTEHQDISGKADKATTLEGYGITDAYTKSEVNDLIPTLEGMATEEYVNNYHDATKQDKLIAGKNITIENNVISASGSGGSGEVYTAGDGLTLSQDNVFSVNETIARTSNVNELLSAKQDVINDLDVIRSGALLGTTALQSFTETDPTVPSHVKSITQEDITNWNNKSDFSGNYNDLTNKPIIPEETTETKVSEWGFTKNTGTITSVKMNGKIVSSIGEADLGTVITEHQDITGKADKATTLLGYGITDAYTKTEVNNLIPSLDGLATEEYVNNYHDATKQDKLTAGKDITIENNVISNTYSFDDTEILVDISDLQNDVQNLQTEIVKKANTTEVSNALATKQDTLIFDSVPTLNSKHPVYSNGIKESIDTKQDKSTAVNYDNISNCITEIPQDIKLELNNGTLTLKTGSKVYIPNGFESNGITKKFDVKNIKSDVTTSPTENGTFLYGVHPNGTLARYSNSFSGDTQPTNQYLCAWYDTTNNKVKRYITNIWEEGFSFPIAIVTISNNKDVSIDQVFNGFGYIGSTVFALPGVKGLIPNGRNADGSLKNLLSINNSVQIYTLLSSETKENIPIYVKQNGSFFRALRHIYDEKNNFNLNFGDINYCYVGPYVSYTNGKITSFTPKIVFHALDYNDFSDLKNTVDTNDSNVVHKTGNEIIAGVKTFQDDITAPNQIDYTNITNCITEIPQDIKLELNNGTLTLKAGSKLYMPNGSGVFNIITMNVDAILGQLWKTNNQVFVVYTPALGTLSLRAPADCSSGSTDSLSGRFHFWYDTANNLIKAVEANGTARAEYLSFPLALVTMTGNGTASVASIDQVFNGFGYIGKRNFITNVKFLIAKGYNTDGTYHNQEYIINSPIVARNDFGDNSIMFFRNNNGDYQIYNITKRYYLGELDYIPNVGEVFQWYYNIINRMWYMHEQWEQTWRQVDYANIGINTSTETNFKEVFKALDYNDKSTISGWSMPSSRYINLSLAASGSTYTAPANGYFYLGKSHSSAGGIIDMQNITSKVRLQTSNVVANDYMFLYLPARKNDIIRINYRADGTLNGFMFIFAEGEN